MPKISDLPSQSPALGTDEFAINDTGVSKKVTASELNLFMDHVSLKNVGSNTHAQIDAHISNIANPHVVTKTQVGLSDVQNILSNFVAVLAPTVSDDDTAGYSVGSRWVDTVTNKAYVCLDNSTGAAVWKETTADSSLGYVRAEPINYTSSARNPYASRSAGSSASTQFSFTIPSDFSSVSDFYARGIAGATAASLNIDLTVGYTGLGEAYNANSNTDTTTNYNTTLDEFLEIDLTGLTTGFSAGDEVGVEIMHVGIGQTNYYTSVVFEYIKA